MKILGISAYYHDSAAALIENGKVLYAAQEERFSRIKNDPSFPMAAIKFCLEEAGLEMKDVDIVSFYDKPFLKFERILETHYAYAPKGFRSFVKAMPIWLKEKLFIKQMIQKRMEELHKSKLHIPIYFPEHHLSHAASAFYTSPFKRCAYLTIDGVGEWSTSSYGIACGEKGIKVLGEIRFPDSLGLFYSSFTYFLGFEVNGGEYKMMGLAPYAHEYSNRVQHFTHLIKDKLIDIKNDGSFRLNDYYFDYQVGLRMVKIHHWERLFGFCRRKPQDCLEQVHADLAHAAQSVLEEVLIRLIQFVQQETKEEYLCLAGGVALNCVANSVMFHQNRFKDIFVQPAAGDAGGALGAALAIAHIQGNMLFTGLKKPFDVYLGPKATTSSIEHVLRKYSCDYTYYAHEDDLRIATAKYIAAKKVVGWFRGRSEFGPRALGNRSILADATDPKMQYILNMKIKFREGFRPFAPVVCEEDYALYFEPGKHSYYMLFTNQVKKSIRKIVPDDFWRWSIDEKRKFPKSELPAIHTY
ncbi:carbamoyltransferase family protein [Saccharicrinis fermentans]|uniref:Putative carbamoyl transferase n=1 Tax=Saccharicrinis fermentans DSM 9555 = JCM 21142 TaxID=869213 RepID=W7YNN2_9BACT|nr:carbamoyltransferase N-terminal domain-containing protein [Saccharicrinis fermentans]GAF04039.1 putative carbamoyl transferase [Saccharicrinis fermentans DSM 9555 = JCM 21142]